VWKLFFKVKSQPSASRACPRCAKGTLRRKLATHSVQLTGKLEGRRVDIYRVEHDHCRKCGYLVPTPDGKAKIKRCTKKGIEFFYQNLPYKTRF
jgi:hypothetical protein